MNTDTFITTTCNNNNMNTQTPIKPNNQFHMKPNDEKVDNNSCSVDNNNEAAVVVSSSSSSCIDNKVIPSAVATSPSSSSSSSSLMMMMATTNDEKSTTTTTTTIMTDGNNGINDVSSNSQSDFQQQTTGPSGPSTSTSTTTVKSSECRHHQQRQPITTTSNNKRPTSTSTLTPKRQRRLLDFTKVQHSGCRKPQLAQLNAQLELAKAGHSSTAVIEGYSGCGKTALVEAFVNKYVVVNQNDNVSTGTGDQQRQSQHHPSPPPPPPPLLGKGKFEERTAASEPFAAISELVDGIVENMLQRKEGDLWTSRIADAVGLDILILLDIIPSLAKLGSSNSNNNNNNSGSGGGDCNYHDHDNNYHPVDDTTGGHGGDGAAAAYPGSGVAGSGGETKSPEGEVVDTTTTTDIITTAVEENNNNNTSSRRHQKWPSLFHHVKEQQRILSNTSSECSSSSSLDFEAFGNLSKKEWRFERFRIAFRELMRCISTYETTLVLILDDMQFAEQDSLALIQTVMDDTTPNLKLLLICATRPLPSSSSPSSPSSSPAAVMTSTPSCDSLFGSSSSNDNNKNKNDETSQTTTAAASPPRPLKNFYYDRLLPSSTNMNNSGRTNKSQSQPLLLIRLGGLSQQEICQLLQTLLELHHSNQHLRELAKVIYEKTLGNAFVVTHCIRQLELRGLIYYDVNQKPKPGWTWDRKRILAQAGSSETVEEVIVKSLKALDRHQRLLLITAASFGVSHFEVSVIVHAISAVEDDSGRDEMLNEDEHYSSEFQVRNAIADLGSELDISVRNGFVENVRDGVFKFSHDRIREAAYSLLPSGDARKRLHLKIGRQLRRWMDTEAEYGTTLLSDDTLTMHAAKHLSYGSDLVSDTWEQIDIAELNLQAAEIAAKKAAFFPSMDYLKNGIRVLGPNAWNDHFDLCLKLHVAMTRIQFSCGLMEACNETAEKVIVNAKTFEQKKDVYNQKLLCLLQQERAIEGVNLAMSILKGLGYKAPKRFLTLYVVRQYIKVESFLKKVTDDEIREIPEFSDPQAEDELNILTRIGELTYFGAPAVYLNFSSLDMLNILIERGNHPLITPMGLVLWATIQVIEGNFAESKRFGALSVEMAERLCDRNPAVEARIICLKHFFLDSWYHGSVQDLVEPLVSNFRLLLKCGAMDNYHTDGVNAPRFLFLCGRPLCEVKAQCRKYMDVLQDYKRTFLWNLCAPLAQVISNFSGDTNEPSILAGEILDSTVLSEIENSKVDTGRFQYQLYSMILAYHFGQPEKAASFEKMLRKDLWAEGSEPPSVSTRVFYSGLVYAALYRQKKGRGNKRKAMAKCKMIKEWVAKGAINLEYMKLILEAELTGIKSESRVEDVQTQFEEAIRSTAKMGILHHEALANELACDFLVRRSNGEDHKNGARRFLKRSLDCYETWGGHAKVQELKSRYSNLIAN